MEEGIEIIVNADGVVINVSQLGFDVPGIDKVIQLKSGDLARIYQGKGKHARIATRMCGGNQDLYMSALLAQLVEFSEDKGRNWTYRTAEDFDDMPLADYSQLVGHFGESFM